MKKAKKFFIFIVIILLILLALAFYFNWFDGLGLGNGFNLKQSENFSPKEDTSSEKLITIVIEKDSIYYNGDTAKSLTIEELTSIIIPNDQNLEFILIDKGASLGTYEAVEKVLFQNHLKYTEKTEK